MSWEAKLFFLTKRKLMKVNSEIFPEKLVPAVLVLTVMFVSIFRLNLKLVQKETTRSVPETSCSPPFCNVISTWHEAHRQLNSVQAIHINYGILGFISPYLCILFSAAQFAGERKSYAKKIGFLWVFHFINWIIASRTVYLWISENERTSPASPAAEAISIDNRNCKPLQSCRQKQ